MPARSSNRGSGRSASATLARKRRAPTEPHDFFAAAKWKPTRYLRRWGVTAQDIDRGLTLSPSLRGMFRGYVDEQKLRDNYFIGRKRITGLTRPDDHDRTRKYDLEATYRGVPIRIEVKGVQTSSIRKDKQRFAARFQLDGSDRRSVTLANGKVVETTLVRVNDFDILAVALFEFGRGWKFAFALNSELKRTEHPKYPLAVRRRLLSSNQVITWPLQEPYVRELYPLMDRVVEARPSKRGSAGSKRRTA